MLISEEFFQKLNPSYQKIINELEEEIRKEKDFKEFVIKEYSMEYLLPKEYWNFVYSTKHTSNENFWKAISERAYFHFYWNEKYPWQNKASVYDSDNFDDKWKHIYLLKFNFKYKSDGGDLYYPNIYLKEAFHEYEKDLNRGEKYLYETGERAMRSSTKTCRAKVEEMIELCNKIEAAAEKDDDIVEWFYLICESNHIEFIRSNVEQKLGQNLLNTKLWKLYIEYLNKTDTDEMLHLYSKYCRFFMDDLEMKEKYKTEMTKYGPIKIKWNNLFDFEESGKNLEVCQEKYINRRIERKKYFHTFDDCVKWDNSIYDSTIHTKFYKTFKFQDFSLPKPLIAYFLQESKATVLRKLFGSCKYFFYKKSTPLCYRFEARNYRSNFLSRFFYDNLSAEYEHVVSMPFKKYHITTTLFLKNDKKGVKIFDITPIVSKFYRCDAKYIEISNHKLTYSDLKFLIQSKNVIELYIACSRERKNDVEIIALEDIMQFLPNIASLYISDMIKFNNDTPKKLMKYIFFGKIYKFEIHNIVGEEFDPYEFHNFIVTNKEKYLQMGLEFNKNFISLDFVEELNSVMKCLINDITSNQIKISHYVEDP